MSRNSLDTHKYSPRMAVTERATPVVTHQPAPFGTPATAQQLAKCTRYVVAAKSRHFFARPTTTHRKQASRTAAHANAEMNLLTRLDERRTAL